MTLRHALPALFIAALAPQLAAAEAGAPAARGPWELVRDDGGIVVHRRTVPGSGLHEFRGVGVIEAPLGAVLGVLDDADHRREWMKEAVANVRIARTGPYDEILYSRTGAPWPVADRDVVNTARTTFDGPRRQVRIEFTSVSHPSWPPQKGVVRMPSLRGHWYMTPVRGGAWTRIEYQLHADPGGSLPGWVVNLVSRNIPHDTIAGVQRQVKRRRYPEFERRMAALPEYQAVVAAVEAPAQPAQARQ